MSDRKPGMIVAVRSCARCLRILAPTSGDDCPDHTLPCCGGKGAQHATGCEQDPMFIAGREWAMRREAAVLRAMGFLGSDQREGATRQGVRPGDLARRPQEQCGP